MRSVSCAASFRVGVLPICVAPRSKRLKGSTSMRPRANGKDNDNSTSADRLREFRARNQGQQPPNRPTPPTAANLGGTIGCIGAVIIGLLILSSATTLLSTWVDWQWFGSLGYQAVYGTV